MVKKRVMRDMVARMERVDVNKRMGKRIVAVCSAIGFDGEDRKCIWIDASEKNPRDDRCRYSLPW